MASITEMIKNIRNAILGKEVRESIASAIEQCYEDANKNDYQGNVVNLGFTKFEQCTKDGYYNFTMADLSSIADKPLDLNSGGVLRVEKNASANVIYQTIVDNEGNQWFRYNSNSFYKVSDVKGLIDRGNVVGLGFTKFEECNRTGTYSFRIQDLVFITDKPKNLNSGGILHVEKNTSSGINYQTITDVYGNVWFRISTEEEFTQIIAVSNDYKFRGNIENLGYTSFDNCDKNGYYNFITTYVDNITDKPQNLTKAGVIRTEKPSQERFTISNYC